jgi:hypothetical protein
MQGKDSEVRTARRGGTSLFGSRMARIARKFSKEVLDIKDR